MANAALNRHFDSVKAARVADGLVVAVAVSLPWSTSATSILLVAWLFAFVPTLDWNEIKREAVSPAGGLPLLLLVLGIAGMAWADVSLIERWKGLDSFVKLLAIPLLLVQFRRSGRGERVFAGYAIACLAVLLVSFGLALWPHEVFLFSHDFGVPVKNAATQSGEFVTCIFGLAFLAYRAYERARWPWLIGLLAAMAAFFVNMLFVATGRTALVTVPVLLVLFAIRTMSRRGMVGLLAAAIAIGAVGWFSSPYLRVRMDSIWTDLQTYEASDTRNSSGERIEFAKKSIAFIREAPVVGHGTGSIPSLFRRAAEGQTGAAGSVTTNPHNQTFAVAIQLGLVGAAVLWAMWIVHLLLFRGAGLAEWVGLVVVAQNIVGSLFNSHLFDFAQGWVYVLGVGVAGGMALKRRAPQPP